MCCIAAPDSTRRWNGTTTELRRHVTLGQRAMGYAMRHPKAVKYKRGRAQFAESGEFSGVAHQRVSEARAVLAYSPELTEAVMQDGKPCKRHHAGVARGAHCQAASGRAQDAHSGLDGCGCPRVNRYQGRAPI